MKLPFDAITTTINEIPLRFVAIHDTWFLCDSCCLSEKRSEKYKTSRRCLDGNKSLFVTA